LPSRSVAWTSVRGIADKSESFNSIGLGTLPPTLRIASAAGAVAEACDSVGALRCACRRPVETANIKAMSAKPALGVHPGKSKRVSTEFCPLRKLARQAVLRQTSKFALCPSEGAESCNLQSFDPLFYRFVQFRDPLPEPIGELQNGFGAKIAKANRELCAF